MDRSFFVPHALEVAPKLLGVVLSVKSDEGEVQLRITETEAYHGLGVPGVYDAGSHSKDRKTDRNASMFGPPGHAYVYFTYGMHYAINMVCSPAGIASGVLIRAGEVIAGHELALARRISKRLAGSTSTASLSDPATIVPQAMLARGPGNLATALGIERVLHDGADLFRFPFSCLADTYEPLQVAQGPRVGVAGEAGGPAFPWRFWIKGDPTVSTFRPGRGAPK